MFRILKNEIWESNENRIGYSVWKMISIREISNN